MKFEDLDHGDYFEWKNSIWKKIQEYRAKSACRVESLGFDSQQRTEKTFKKDQEVQDYELSSSEDS